MGWSDWYNSGNEKETEKVTKTESGTKTETLRTTNCDKENHQHTYVEHDNDGKLKGGDATPPKKER